MLFGTYEQDNNKETTDTIEWVKTSAIGSSSDGTFQTLMSLQALSAVAWNSTGSGNDWSKDYCNIRSWLNGTFYDTFDATQKAAIAKTSLTTYKYDSTDVLCLTDGDYVFLPSAEEAKDMSNLVCYPTASAIAAGCWINSSTGSCDWWLRSPGEADEAAADVNSSGGINGGGGNYVGDAEGAVRPVINLLL